MSMDDAVNALRILEKSEEDKKRETARQSDVSFGRAMQEFKQSEIWVSYMKPLIDARLAEAHKELEEVKKGDAEWPNNLIRAQEKGRSCKFMMDVVEAPIKNMRRILKEDGDE